MRVDGHTYEDELLNALVNRPDREVRRSPSSNAEITTEYVYQVSLRCVLRARVHPLRIRPPTIFGRTLSRNGSNDLLTRSFGRTSNNSSLRSIRCNPQTDRRFGPCWCPPARATHVHIGGFRTCELSKNDGAFTREYVVDGSCCIYG